MKKITKREVLEGMMKWLKGEPTEDGIALSVEDAIKYCENELVLLDKKAAKSKEAQAKRKAAGDELTAIVVDALTDEFQSIADITLKVAETIEDATPHKVQYRLSQLAKLETPMAVKGTVTIPGDGENKSRTAAAYKLA